ncbi:hypothetical protein G4228_020470, partial [Cervus hanglu yarkandensis]
CPLRHKELTTVRALVEEAPMETSVRVSSGNQRESRFSRRRRRGRYPAKQLLNCLLVLKGTSVTGTSLLLVSIYHL